MRGEADASVASAFGEVLREYHIRAGLSQSDLASKKFSKMWHRVPVSISGPGPSSKCPRKRVQAAMIALAALISVHAEPSYADTKPWTYSITLDGYFTHNETSYLNPNLTADRNWLHLEARYNYENLQTASLWAGYNFSAGKNVVLNITPMIGTVFGKTNGFAPGCEASLTYKHVALSISNEYVFDTAVEARSFYYSWIELSYSPTDWFRVGAVTQHTKAFHESFEVQPGFLAGVSHKQWEFTAYVFSASLKDPTVVLEAGVNF